jgi:hypothetical protein
MLFVNCFVLPLRQASICVLHPQALGLRSEHISIKVKNECATKIPKKKINISHALGLNETTLHIIHHSAAKLKDNVDSRSPVGALNIADDQDKECSPKVAQNEQTATSCHTKMYREKSGISGKSSPLL